MIFKATFGIAEDHDEMRSLLKQILATYNYSVIIEAKNGQDLLKNINNTSERPLICFVNANMPVMDGCETVKQLKEKYPEIKIIAYSEDKIKGYKMLRRGADDYLSKRSEPETIKECIEKLLERIAYCQSKNK